jgi:hypothetical protein
VSRFHWRTVETAATKTTKSIKKIEIGGDISRVVVLEESNVFFVLDYIRKFDSLSSSLKPFMSACRRGIQPNANSTHIHLHVPKVPPPPPPPCVGIGVCIAPLQQKLHSDSSSFTLFGT